jgi:hypothetical protein
MSALEIQNGGFNKMEYEVWYAKGDDAYVAYRCDSLSQANAYIRSWDHEGAEWSIKSTEEFGGLSAEDLREAETLAATIKARTFDNMHDGAWQKADRTPALSALVHNLVFGPSAAVTAAEQLEQFYRYGDIGLPRGGKVWKREEVAAKLSCRTRTKNKSVVHA